MVILLLTLVIWNYDELFHLCLFENMLLVFFYYTLYVKLYNCLHSKTSGYVCRQNAQRMKTVQQTNSAVSSFTSVKSVLMILDASVTSSAVEGKFASLGDA